jgi:hypothetical protein
MSTYQRISLGDLQDRLMAMTDGVGVYWLAPEKKDALQEALRIWQAMTFTWNASHILAVTSGHYYDVPRQICFVQRVSYNGSGLAPTSLTELDYGFPGWEGTTGTPQSWAPVGVNRIAVYPAPVTGSLLFEGVKELDPLGSLEGKVNIGDEELTRILDYAQHYLSFKEGPPEQEATTPLFQDFLVAAGLKNSHLVATEMYKDAMGFMKDTAERPPQTGA